MPRKKLYLLSLLSGALFFFGWPPYGFTFILFFAFVPLLYIEHVFSSGQVKARTTLLFGLSYIAFFIWNLTTTFWVCNASMGGGAIAILANSFIMSAVFWLFHITKRRLLAFHAQLPTPNWLLVIFWPAYEHFHHRWDLTWPWLALGNAFSDNPTWIQWYEYTGTPGGSLWVLLLNLMIYNWLFNRQPGTSSRKRITGISALIMIPIIISWFMYGLYGVNQTPPPKTVNVVVVQPNIDPYSEKFSGMNYEEQLNKMLALAKTKVDSATDYAVFPETALTESIWDNELEETGSYAILKEFLKPFPNLKIVIGASTWHLYEEGEKRSVTARKFKNQEGYYDAFNTAFQIDHSDAVQKYHKSKLVPGVERMPYPAVFGFLEDLAIDLGGTAGSLGTQEERTVFTSPTLANTETENGRTGEGERTAMTIAPVICYESIFGEFVTEYVKKGASLVFIITNDGWWGNTPGFRQHLVYGRLRAIETRRDIARSANTGISCFINQRGDISEATEWWQPAVIKMALTLNSEETFYVKWGDLIGKFCFYLSGLLLVYALIVLRFLKR